MINERLWLFLGLMMITPILFIMILPDPYSTVATLGTNLAMLFYIRKSFKGMAQGMFGGKMKYQCLTCGGNKFDSIGACYRCGSKQKRPI